MRIVVLILGLVAIGAVSTMVVSLVAFQGSRERAARDSCELLRHIVLSATPPEQAARAVVFLERNGLDDAHGRDSCPAYAGRLVR